METSHDRHFSDIRPGGRRHGSRLLGRLWGRGTVNLRPHFVRRSPLLAGLLLLALLGGGFVMRKIFTRGETADFFPAACLGTWQNPVYAQGQPDTFADATVPLDDRNSAVFLGGDQQIFCGSFVLSSVEDKGELTGVGLSLAWRMEGAAPEPIQESPVTSSTATTTPLEASTTVPAEAPAAFRLIPLALAEESEAPPAEAPPASTEPSAEEQAPVVVEPAPEPAPVAVPAPASSEPVQETDEPQTVIIAPPLHAELSEDPTSTTIPTVDTSTQTNVGGAPEAQELLSGPAPDDHFLSVGYSLDGQTWIELQKVGVENWQNFTIDLPVKSWDELRRVQIRVVGTPTILSHVPKMYLDGMFLEARYEVAPILSGISGEESTSTTLSLGQNSSIELPASSSPALVPPPEIVTSTLSGGRLSVTVRYVGEFMGGNSVNVFVYPAHTRARRSGSENAFAFAEEAPEGPVLDSLQLRAEDFNSDKEATVELVAPGRGGEAVDPADMRPGSYNIDLAYYDGQMWRITPPRSFDWP